jgi:hypothetical protein
MSAMTANDHEIGACHGLEHLLAFSKQETKSDETSSQYSPHIQAHHAQSKKLLFRMRLERCPLGGIHAYPTVDRLIPGGTDA